MTQPAHTHDLKSELEKSAALLRTLRDEILVQIHLGALEAKSEWDRLEPRLENALESARQDVSERSRIALADAMQAARRFRESLR